MKLKKQQSPFFLLCFFEFFERFGYYGFSYTSILYFMSNSGFDFTEKQAVLLFGGFASLTYVFNAIGGYVADSIYGIKRTMFLGAVFLALGYFSLAVTPYFKVLGGFNIYLSLAAIIVGSALFKPAPTNMIAKIYTDKSQLDSIYTYFYMSINLGSLLASLSVPLIATKYGYTAAYGLCSFGLVLGIVNSILSFNSIKEIDNRVGLSNTSFIKNISVLVTFILAIFALGLVLRQYH